MQYIAEKCHHLQQINLQSCHNITDNGIEFIYIYIKSIYISLGLKALSEGCSELKTISLADCKNITNVGLMFISQQCTSLQNLNVWGSPITDDGLTYLADSKIPLQSVLLGNSS